MRLGRRRFSLLALFSALAGRGAVAAAAAARDGDEADVLALMARALFPHEAVTQDQYRSVAAAFVSANATQAGRLAQVLGGDAFVTAPAAERLAALRGIERTPDFQVFRFHSLVMLYNDPSVTRTFGYQGPSLSHGGYLNRGFDDIDWLPEGGIDAG